MATDTGSEDSHDVRAASRDRLGTRSRDVAEFGAFARPFSDAQLTTVG